MATSLFLADEFCSGLVTSGNIGSSGATFAVVNTGTIAGDKGTGNNPCVIQLNSHATNDNSGATVHYFAANGSFGDATTWVNSDWALDALFRPGANSTAITNTAW